MKKILLVVLLFIGCGDDTPVVKKPLPKIGQTKEDVLMNWGRPIKIIRLDSIAIYTYEQHIVYRGAPCTNRFYFYFKGEQRDIWYNDYFTAIKAIGA